MTFGRAPDRAARRWALAEVSHPIQEKHSPYHPDLRGPLFCSFCALHPPHPAHIDIVVFFL